MGLDDLDGPFQFADAAKNPDADIDTKRVLTIACSMSGGLNFRSGGGIRKDVINTLVTAHQQGHRVIFYNNVIEGTEVDLMRAMERCRIPQGVQNKLLDNGFFKPVDLQDKRIRYVDLAIDDDGLSYSGLSFQYHAHPEDPNFRVLMQRYLESPTPPLALLLNDTWGKGSQNHWTNNQGNHPRRAPDE